MFDGIEDRRVVVLRLARAELAREGAWAHGFGDGGKHCAIGWIMQIADSWTATIQLTDHLFRVLPWYWRLLGAITAYQVNDSFAIIAIYNDCSWRTQQQMLALFDRAIARLSR